MDQTIKLEVTVNETNAILRLLGKQPYDEVAELIQKIKQQGESQLEAQQQTAPVES